MPSFDADGNLSYSGYTAEGFKIYYLSKNELNGVDETKKYVWINNPPLGVLKPLGDLKKDQIEKLKYFNDYELPDYKKDKYSGFFSRLSIFPTIRFDNYNLTNKFFDKIKPGVLLASNDALNRYGMTASISLNRKCLSAFCGFAFVVSVCITIVSPHVNIVQNL